MKPVDYSALIIDDDVDLCHLLSRVLACNKINVASAHSLEEAEKLLQKGKPKLIFLDNNLPDGLGIDFMKKIKAIDEEIKVIMITGDTAANIEHKARESGIDSFITKPFRFDTIREYALKMVS